MLVHHKAPQLSSKCEDDGGVQGESLMVRAGLWKLCPVGSSIWRSIGFFPFFVHPSLTLSNLQVFGTVYWLDIYFTYFKKAQWPTPWLFQHLWKCLRASGISANHQQFFIHPQRTGMKAQMLPGLTSGCHQEPCVIHTEYLDTWVISWHWLDDFPEYGWFCRICDIPGL